MRTDFIIGFEFLILAVIHGGWMISAVIRAFKTQYPPKWPLSGRWILALYVLAEALVFADIVYLRVTHTVGHPGIHSTILRGFFVLMSLWATWRWLRGNLLDARDEYK